MCIISIVHVTILFVIVLCNFLTHQVHWDVYLNPSSYLHWLGPGGGSGTGLKTLTVQIRYVYTGIIPYSDTIRILLCILNNCTMSDLFFSILVEEVK